MGGADMADVYSTSDAASMVGASPVTIRSWKQRKGSRLIEGEHWLNQDGQLFWTTAGISALQAIKGASGSDAESASPTDAAVDASTSDAPSNLDTEGDALPILQRYQPLIDMLASALTPRLQQKLDEKIQRNLVKGDAPPMTTVECVAVLMELGLKPADPAALLNGNYTAGLIAGSDDDDQQGG
ncbi:MAG TPA: hypothetical protein V6D12_00320 [Candidatus Obscuribacterales bacterium]